MTMGLLYPFLSSIILLFFAICRAHDSTFDEYAQDTLASEYGGIKFSAMAFRHGDRYGRGNFPANKHSDLFKARKGQLTEVGKTRAHSLGRWTHMRYIHLIGENPHDAELFNMISSPSKRAVHSGRLFLAGFYRPNSEDHQDGAGVPQEHISLPQNDRMMTMNEYCARYNVEVEVLKRAGLSVLNLDREDEELLKTIKLHTGLSIPKEDPIVRTAELSLLFDTLHVMKELDLEPPECTPTIYPRLQEIAVLFFRLRTFNDEMKRLKAGPLLGHIVNELKTKRDQPQSKKVLQFYSGHDSGIVALLDALNIWDGIMPTYSSALFFELRELDDQLIVTLSYRNSEERPPVLLDMPDCPNPCTLNNFIQFTTERLIPEDWDKECETLNYNRVLF